MILAPLTLYEANLYICDQRDTLRSVLRSQYFLNFFLNSWIDKFIFTLNILSLQKLYF